MNEYWIISCYSFITCLSSKGYPVRGFDKICNLHKQQVERKDKAIISENVNEEDNMKQEKQEKQDDYVDPELADVIEELDIMEKQETNKKVENIQKTMMNASTENRRRERAYDV